MKRGDIIRHCKNKNEGVIIRINDEYVEVLLTKQGAYNPEVYNVNEVEVIK